MGILRTNTVSGIETPTPVTGSVLFDGNGDYLTLASSGDFSFGIGNFTIEWFQYWNSLSGFQDLLDINYTAGLLIETGNGGGKYNVYAGSNTIITAEPSSPETGKWHHYTLVGNRTAGTMTLYRNCVLSNSGSWATNINAGSASNTLSIGCRANGANPVNGYISNLRILKGTALYTSNFTPPTRELQRIGDTVLLCCNNPDSAGAEATGKTITVNGNAAASTFSPGLVRDFTYGTQFDGVTKFDTQGYFVPPSGTTEQRSRGRGLFGGGINPASINQIEYIEIQSQGNSIDFGDLIQSRLALSASSSNTRGIFAGGEDPARVNIIDYISIQNTSNALDFGDLSVKKSDVSACSSNTRSLIGGGYDTPAQPNVIEYLTISSLGNSQTFGSLSAIKWGTGSCSSPTRGIFAGGNTPATINVIEYITIASTGNVQDFGDLTQARYGLCGCSSQTRGVFAGGGVAPLNTNIIDFITIASTGNAQDFGDLSQEKRSFGGASSSVRGVFSGGLGPALVNTVEYIIISTTSNTNDFGDLIQPKMYNAGLSDSHGGLS